MSTIQQLKDSHNSVIRTKTASGSITPQMVADLLDSHADELLARGLAVVDDTTALSALSGADFKTAIVNGNGIYTHGSTGSANGTTIFAATGGGFFTRRHNLAAGQALTAGSDISIVGGAINVTGSKIFFKPTQIQSCVLKCWYDFTDASNCTISAADLVSQVNDKSGLGNHLVQATGANQPLYKYSGGPNNLPYINFTSGKRLALASLAVSQPFTMFLVVRQNTAVDRAVLVGLDAPSGGNVLTGISQYLDTTVTPNVYSTTIVAGAAWRPIKVKNYYKNQFALLRVIFNGASSDIRIMDELRWQSYYYGAGTSSTYIINPGAGAVTKVVIGSEATAQPDMDVCEFALFSGIISDEEDKKYTGQLMAKYGLVNYDYIAFFGDSITEGFNATDRLTLSWPALTANEKNKNFYNYGITSTTVYRSGAADKNFVTTVNFMKYATNGYAVVAFGTNDDTITDTNWKAVYKGFIQRLISYGYNPAKVIICSPPYQSNKVTNLSNVRTICSQIASELGIPFCDFYTATQANGGDALLSDGTHPNDTGHRFMADTLKPFIS